MVQPKLHMLELLTIRTDTEEDATYALDSLLEQHIISMLGKYYTVDTYTDATIVVYDNDKKDAINILRHSPFVNMLFENKGISPVGTQSVEYETEYIRSLGEKFEHDCKSHILFVRLDSSLNI